MYSRWSGEGRSSFSSLKSSLWKVAVWASRTRPKARLWPGRGTPSGPGRRPLQDGWKRPKATCRAHPSRESRKESMWQLRKVGSWGAFKVAVAVELKKCNSWHFKGAEPPFFLMLLVVTDDVQQDSVCCFLQKLGSPAEAIKLRPRQFVDNQNYQQPSRSKQGVGLLALSSGFSWF